MIFLIFKRFCFCILCIFPMYGCVSDDKNNSIKLHYDKHNHILLIYNFESARYIKKIELDVQHDTLLIGKVSRKLVPIFEKRRKKIDWFMIECAVILQPTVEFVKCGDRLFKLSEIDEYSHEELIHKRYKVITVFPKEFPCVIP